MSTILQDQIQTADRSADELLQKDHRAAMFCCDVEDLVELDLFLFEKVRERIAAWQLAVSGRASDSSTAEQEAQWHALDVQLEKGLRKTINLVNAIEAEGHRVNDKPRLLNAWRELRFIVAATPASIRHSLQQIQEGRFRVLSR